MAGAFSSAFSSAFDGGADQVVPKDTHVAAGGGFWRGGADERKRQQIADDLRALYRELYERPEVAEEAAEVVVAYAPVSAVEIPPPEAIDWDLMASEGAAAIAAALGQLRDMLRETNRLMAEEDDIEVLLMVT